MVHPYSLAAGAALLMSVSHLASAYSGDPGIDKASLPAMMQFDHAPASDPRAELPATTDAGAGTTRAPQARTSKAGHDEFQRYFDRHYRAHLVLDSAARRDTDVE